MTKLTKKKNNNKTAKILNKIPVLSPKQQRDFDKYGRDVERAALYGLRHLDSK